jgi:Alpha-glutamyl/putrescinyl thymine pyrophosphorylase clade 3
LKPKEQRRAAEFKNRLLRYDADVECLAGLHPAGHLDCLVWQLVESRRRIEFVHHIRDAQHHPDRMNPLSNLFDPLRAAVLHHRQGHVDEAYWLVFLAVHFGKHIRNGWRLTRDIYGRLGGPGRWDWESISKNLPGFRLWLEANQQRLGGQGFSNHRKFESLRVNSSKGTAAVFESYVAWVKPPKTHGDLIRAAHLSVGQNPQDTFDHLYRSMDPVLRFGRLGRFDYLTMLGKLGIAPIDPGSAYLWHNASGPLDGARLLFGGKTDANIRARELDAKLIALDHHLGVGMQALEDALCNWQKSPNAFTAFRG